MVTLDVSKVMPPLINSLYELLTVPALVLGVLLTNVNKFYLLRLYLDKF